jgi:hypothetical protein
MAPVLKTGIPERVSGVRIPHSPPVPQKPRQIHAKSQIVIRLCYSASLLSKIQQMRVLAKMNRTVKLYCSVKRPSGDWGTKPVPDKQLMNLKDLPEGQGHYYLAYYEGKHRQMPPVGSFADAAKQKLIQKRQGTGCTCNGRGPTPNKYSDGQDDWPLPLPRSAANVRHGCGQSFCSMATLLGETSLRF